MKAHRETSTCLPVDHPTFPGLQLGKLFRRAKTWDEKVGFVEVSESGGAGSGMGSVGGACWIAGLERKSGGSRRMRPPPRKNSGSVETSVKEDVEEKMTPLPGKSSVRSRSAATREHDLITQEGGAKGT